MTFAGFAESGLLESLALVEGDDDTEGLEPVVRPWPGVVSPECARDDDDEFEYFDDDDDDDDDSDDMDDDDDLDDFDDTEDEDEDEDEEF